MRVARCRTHVERGRSARKVPGVKVCGSALERAYGLLCVFCVWVSKYGTFRIFYRLVFKNLYGIVSPAISRRDRPHIRA